MALDGYQLALLISNITISILTLLLNCFQSIKENHFELNSPCGSVKLDTTTIQQTNSNQNLLSTLETATEHIQKNHQNEI